ncbi:MULTISPECIES: LCP family protein [Streptomyces]|uniref:LCP family protein n=1 Tax=Streptomyces changanensis TaxID=2964669 RepID=A0ABY5N615_9ACTN|nr:MULTISPECIES: LCP family protein [Streptomyces]UUS31387.1 LCP family protein [Streptomyces changanensis]
MGHSSVRGEGTRESVPHARNARDRGRGDDTADGAGPAADRNDDGGAAGTGADAGFGARAGRRGARRADPDGPDADGDGAAGGPGQGDRPGSRGAGSGRRRAGQRPRRSARTGKRRVLRWVASVLSLLILGTAGAGYLYIEHLNGNIRSGGRSGGDSGVEKAAPDASGNTPLNILLIGADGRNSKENLALGGAKDTVGDKPRGDVQMLLHVARDRRSAAVVSIPRDTRVDIPACQDDDTGEKFPATNRIITESLQRGGPGCTLTTWEKLTGVYIDHWMMVDFAGVVRMADAVGGVPVCVRQNVHDRPTAQVSGGSGLKLRQGTTYVKGEQALQWLRTRHAFFNDQGRAKAQHMYMNAMLRQLKDQNAFTDTGRITDLAEAATKAIQVSEELESVPRLFDLAMELKHVPTNRITMTTLPTVEDHANRAHLLPEPNSAERIWKMLREDVPFDDNGTAADAKPSAPPKETGPAAAAPASLAVTVLNGTGADGKYPVKGRAGAVAETLRGKGFTRADASQAAASAPRTRLDYPKASGAQGKADALSVAKAIGLPATAVRAVDGGDGPTLTIGADWREGEAFPKQQDPKAGDLPDDAENSNGADTKACMEVYQPYRW